MQQTGLTNLTANTINNMQNQPVPSGLKPEQAQTGISNKKNNKNGKLLNGIKEIGITAGLGAGSGALAGGIISLIPTKNTDTISNVLCDTFVKNSLNAAESTKQNLSEASFKNADEQLKKAKEYINAGKILENPQLGEDELKNAGQKFSDAAWALKQSAIDYINKAAKDDGLLNFAKKQAKKIRAAEVMKNSVSIGITAALVALLINKISGGHKNNKNDKNTQK